MLANGKPQGSDIGWPNAESNAGSGISRGALVICAIECEISDARKLPCNYKG